ncbi:MAG: RluA family pseudouridine synthase [Desulfobacterales bacterium]|nr:RluA family pseudouridine synthase [Desulfobacterales bacterium]
MQTDPVSEKQEAFTYDAVSTDVGKRLDQVLSARISECSRALCASLIQNGNMRVAGCIKKPGYRVRLGDRICGSIPPPEPVLLEAEPIEIEILYQDDHLIAVNKPPGLVVHPAPGHRSGTLVNALLFHCPQLGAINAVLRPGIVHRLDKDTSGVMIVAKNQSAHNHLAAQFKSRKIHKEYSALVYGEMESAAGAVTRPIGRHPVHRKKMSVNSTKPRDAETLWQVEKRLAGVTLLKVNIKTGRTHQIRVHCAAINHPVVGDPVYGRAKLSPKMPGAVLTVLSQVSRQMLHARRIQLSHPVTGEYMTFEAPVPQDMLDVIEGCMINELTGAHT